MSPSVLTAKVLDHGYVDLIEAWGSDERIIEAARMSTHKGFLGWGPKCKKCGRKQDEHTNEAFCDASEGYEKGDEKLLRFLYENKHFTPFEMGGLTLEVQAPIFVFREWHRHRTQSYNELSARYTPMPDVNYVPTVDRLFAGTTKKCAKCGAIGTWHFGEKGEHPTRCDMGGECEWKTSKQAGVAEGAEVLTLDAALAWLAELADLYEHAERVYQSGLKRGVPKELARIGLPVGRYSRMRVSANLRNWLGFLTLRMDTKAQLEIREYAATVGAIVEARFPRTWDLFVEGRAA